MRPRGSAPTRRAVVTAAPSLSGPINSTSVRRRHLGSRRSARRRMAGLRRSPESCCSSYTGFTDLRAPFGRFGTLLLDPDLHRAWHITGAHLQTL